MTILLALALGCQAPHATSLAGGGLAAGSHALQDPGRAASPWDGTLDRPRFDTRASDFDLELLGYRYTVFHVQADFSPLAAVSPSQVDDLLAGLAEDPRWRVGVWEGAVVAFRRVGDSDGWTVSRHGYHQGDDHWRVALRFDPWPGDSAWRSDAVSTTQASSSGVDLRAFELTEGPGSGMETTALTVQGRAVSLDVFESRRDRGRPRTADALAEAPQVVAALHQGWSTRPAGEPAEGTRPSLSLTAPEPGMLEVRGRINPGAEGWTWLRILDRDGRAFEPAAVAAGTRERVGASERVDELYYFQSRFPVSSGQAFRGTAELWFAADDSRRPRRLGSFEVTVPRRSGSAVTPVAVVRQ